MRAAKFIFATTALIALVWLVGLVPGFILKGVFAAVMIAVMWAMYKIDKDES